MPLVGVQIVLLVLQVVVLREVIRPVVVPHNLEVVRVAAMGGSPKPKKSKSKKSRAWQPLPAAIAHTGS